MIIKKLYYNFPKVIHERTRIIDFNEEFFWAEKFEYNPVVYLLRYPHSLLTYAEAKAKTGAIDRMALEAVNMVKRKANKVDIYSPSVFDLQAGLTIGQFIDSVLWERAWEFCGEQEGRWFDILRLEMVDKLPDLRDTNEYWPVLRYVSEEDYFVPIPEEAAIWF